MKIIVENNVEKIIINKLIKIGNLSLKEGNAIYILLKEDLVSIHDTYYDKIPDNIFKTLILIDPTFKQEENKLGKYGKWILNGYKKGKEFFGNQKIPGEDSIKLTNWLKEFNIYKNKSDFPVKDIMQIKNIESLAGIVEQYRPKHEESKELSTKEQDVTKLYEDDAWLLLIPKTYEAECKYGAHTRWCTTESEYTFNSYMRDGDLLILINKKDEFDGSSKWQFHVESKSYFNDEDKSFDPSSLNTHMPKQLLQVLEQNDVYLFSATNEMVNQVEKNILEQKIRQKSPYLKNFGYSLDIDLIEDVIMKTIAKKNEIGEADFDINKYLQDAYANPEKYLDKAKPKGDKLLPFRNYPKKDYSIQQKRDAASILKRHLFSSIQEYFVDEYGYEPPSEIEVKHIDDINDE
jgi:hypothetical protein